MNRRAKLSVVRLLSLSALASLALAPALAAPGLVRGAAARAGLVSQNSNQRVEYFDLAKGAYFTTHGLTLDSSKDIALRVMPNGDTYIWSFLGNYSTQNWLINYYGGNYEMTLMANWTLTYCKLTSASTLIGVTLDAVWSNSVWSVRTSVGNYYAKTNASMPKVAYTIPFTVGKINGGSGSYSSVGNFRFYYLKFSSNGINSMYLYPVRKDSEPYLFDAVSGTYHALTAGTVTMGPDIPLQYEYPPITDY